MWAPWGPGGGGSANLSISSVTKLQRYKMLETIANTGIQA